MFNAVIDCKESKHAIAKEIRETHRELHGDTLLPSGGHSQISSSLAMDFISTLKTSLKVHYSKRVRARVAARLGEHTPPRSANNEVKQAHALRVAEASYDVLRPAYNEPGCREEDRGLVEQERAFLGLDTLPWEAGGIKKTLSDFVGRSPELLLPGLYRLRAAKVQQGEKAFRLLPMRTTMRPGFLKMDQEVVKDTGLVDKDLKTGVNKRNKDRHEAQKPVEERVKAQKSTLRARHVQDRRGESFRDRQLRESGRQAV